MNLYEAKMNFLSSRPIHLCVSVLQASWILPRQADAALELLKAHEYHGCWRRHRHRSSRPSQFEAFELAGEM